MGPPGEQNRRAPRQQPAGPQRAGNFNAAQQQQQQQQRARQQQANRPPNQLVSAQSNTIEHTLDTPPFRGQAGVEMQPRFQRLRTPPGGPGEQFINNGQPPLQFQPNQNNQNRQPPQMQLPPNPNAQNQQLGVPTLSAFEMASLTNLANQAQFGAQNQANGQQQQPPSFRRIPAQQLQQAQNQRANQGGFEGVSGNGQRGLAIPVLNQVPNPQLNNGNNNNNANANGNGPFMGSQTELPFIRQVFRPVSSQPESARGPPEQAGGESEPLPAQPANEQENRGSRPTPPPLFVPGRQPAVNKVTRLVESGFMPNAGQLGAREVFFEPSQSQANRNQAGPRGRGTTQPLVRGPPVSEPTGQLERRKPPVRRPSQRPQVPQANNAPMRPMQPEPFGPPQPQPAPSSPTDVIRLAANAIQAANEGLTSLSGQPADSATPASGFGRPGGFATPADQIAPSEAPVSTQSVPVSSTSQSRPPSTTSEPAATTTASSGAESSPAMAGRRAAQPLLRTSANFFTLTSAATSSPTSFSPALPINAAVAASGGRRRIPVRNSGQSFAGQQPAGAARLPAGPQTTTMAAVGNPAPLATTTQSPQPSSSRASVRRPEIEEFYETIGATGPFPSSLNAATTIDGFGVPSKQPAPEVPVTTTTTLASNDLYGSRLSAGAAAASESVSTEQEPARSSTEASRVRQPEPERESASAPEPAQQQPQQQQPQLQTSLVSPVMVPVTYMTTFTYLTTVLHGTHTLETSHESVVRSTELATLNAQLMDQIEHRLPLIQPTATLSMSSKTKGRGTTIVNLKSAVSAYNQELVEALGVNTLPASSSAGANQQQLATALAQPADKPSKQMVNQQQQLRGSNNGNINNNNKPLNRASRTVDLHELQEAKKSLLTEFVYLYTMKPVDGSVQPSQLVTSVRSEMFTGTPLDGNELMSLVAQQSNNNNNNQAGVQLIDSDGLLRINQEAQLAPVNLGKCCQESWREDGQRRMAAL